MTLENSDHLPSSAIIWTSGTGQSVGVDQVQDNMGAGTMLQLYGTMLNTVFCVVTTMVVMACAFLRLIDKTAT